MKNNYCDISASCEIVNKLKQTLSEIKQLSDRIVNSDDLLLWDVYELNEQINQKISEVEDGV